MRVGLTILAIAGGVVLLVLLGVAIALFFGWAVIEALKDEGFSTFSPALKQLAIIVVIGGFSAVLAAIMPARRAARLDVLDAISHE